MANASNPFLHPKALHWIAPFAHASAEGCDAACRTLQLPALAHVLHEWHTTGPVLGDPYSLNTPFERAWAQALCWPDSADGTLPLAAWAADRPGVACAWFTPCHWSVGMEQVTLLPPDDLDIHEAESRTLFEALRPLAEEDGLTLCFESATRWRAEGEVFRNLPTASLDRVAHRRVDIWLPDARQTPAVRPLLRLQNEAQMLFYTHPTNDQRASRRALPINGFWISGGGAWEVSADPPRAEVPRPHRVEALRAPALTGDWTQWADAWQTLDGEQLTPWLTSADLNHALTLTLCGEVGHQTWTRAAPTSTAQPPGFWTRLRQAVTPRNNRRPQPDLVAHTLKTL